MAENHHRVSRVRGGEELSQNRAVWVGANESSLKGSWAGTW